VETADTVETTTSSPQIKKRRCLSVDLTTQRSGVRSITPQDMICKDVKLFWITRRFNHQQHMWPRSPNRKSIVGPILPMMMSRWEKSV
jgi:hypothetical protein